MKSLHSKKFHIRISPTETCNFLKDQVFDCLEIIEPDTFGIAVLISNKTSYHVHDVIFNVPQMMNTFFLNLIVKYINMHLLVGNLGRYITDDDQLIMFVL